MRKYAIPVAAAIGALCLLLAALPLRASDTAETHGMKVVSLAYMKSLFLGVETDEAKNVLKIWADRVHKVNFPDSETRISIIDNFAAMERAVREREIDVVSTVSDDFIRLRKSAPIRPIMLTMHGGSVYQQLLLLVRRDRGFRELKDLRRKQITISGEKVHTIHMFWLETLLMREGYRAPGDFFSSVKEVPKTSQAILSVFFRQTDACLTSRRSFELANELNPQVGEELVALEKSAEVVTGVVSVHHDFEPGDREKLARSLETMDKSPAGRQLLNFFRITRFVPFREEYLVSIEAMVKEHDELQRKLARKR